MSSSGASIKVVEKLSISEFDGFPKKLNFYVNLSLLTNHPKTCEIITLTCSMTNCSNKLISSNLVIVILPVKYILDSCKEVVYTPLTKLLFCPSQSTLQIYQCSSIVTHIHLRKNRLVISNRQRSIGS